MFFTTRYHGIYTCTFVTSTKSALLSSCVPHKPMAAILDISSFVFVPPAWATGAPELSSSTVSAMSELSSLTIANNFAFITATRMGLYRCPYIAGSIGECLLHRAAAGVGALSLSSMTLVTSLCGYGPALPCTYAYFTGWTSTSQGERENEDEDEDEE